MVIINKSFKKGFWEPKDENMFGIKPEDQK